MSLQSAVAAADFVLFLAAAMVQVCEYNSPADVHRWSELSGGVLIIGYQALAGLHKPRKARAGANLDMNVAKVTIQVVLLCYKQRHSLQCVW